MLSKALVSAGLLAILVLAMTSTPGLREYKSFTIATNQVTRALPTASNITRALASMIATNLTADVIDLSASDQPEKSTSNLTMKSHYVRVSLPRRSRTPSNNATMSNLTRQPQEPIQPIEKPVQQQPQQCMVVRDDKSNTFSFQGQWHPKPKMATLIDQSHQQFGCRAPLLHPYENLHRCCSADGNRDHLGAVYCPQINTRRAIRSLLNATRHKTIIFLGDSTTLQLFAAVGMALRGHQIPFSYSQKENRLVQSYKVASTNSTISLREIYRLEGANRTGLNLKDEPNNPYHLHDASLQATLKQADILVANFGLHYWPTPEYHYRQYKHVQELVEKENRRRRHNKNNNPLCLLWRRTIPQHFPSRDGSGEWGKRLKDYGPYGCVALNTSAWKHPSDPPLYRIQQEYNYTTPMMDYTDILQHAHAFHSRRKGTDCTHVCYSPLIFNPIMHMTAAAIEQACL